MTPVQLPEVPEPSGRVTMNVYDEFNNFKLMVPLLWGQHDFYTAAQLREYATEAVMVERERLPSAETIERTLHVVYMEHAYFKVTTTLLDDMAKAVANLLTKPERNSGE